MKFIKKTEVIVDITDEMIENLNKDIGKWTGEDYHNMTALDELLDELIVLGSWQNYYDLPNYVYANTTVNSEEGIVDETK